MGRIINQPPRDRCTVAGDVAVAHSDQIEGDEGDSRVAVAQDKGAGEQVVVDAAGGAAQVTVVAAQVEALLKVLGQRRDGEGGGSGQEGRPCHDSAQYSSHRRHMIDTGDSIGSIILPII